MNKTARTRSRGLGRGLDALLGADLPAPTAPGAAEPAVHSLPLDALRPGRYQPRTRMDESSLEELAASIRGHGVMQPIVVRPLGASRWEIIAGERRYRAAGLAGLDGLLLNGHATRRVPHNVNLSFAGLDGEALLLGLPELALSSGSACHSASQQPSHVLRALGRSDELAHASLRISFGRFTTEAEIDHAARAIRDRVARLRAGARAATPT